MACPGRRYGFRCRYYRGRRWRPGHVSVLASPHRSVTDSFCCGRGAVNDVHNLGAMIRTAVFLGVDGVVTSAKNCASLTPGMSHVAGGTAVWFEFLPFYENITTIVAAVAKASSGATEVADVHVTRQMPKFLRYGGGLTPCLAGERVQRTGARANHTRTFRSLQPLTRAAATQ